MIIESSITAQIIEIVNETIVSPSKYRSIKIMK